MIIKADLKYKQTDFSLPRCAIEKVVKLTPTEYAEFVFNPLGYYDFLREFNTEKHGHQPESIPCLLLIGEGHKDGFIIDTQGYDYARYIAHIPNAEQLAIAFRYPNLENAVIETAFAADRIVREAIDSGSKEYSFNTDEERNKFRGAGFSEELLYTALKDRPEIESIDFDGDYMLCTVTDEYVQQSDGHRALTQEEADIMIANHMPTTSPPVPVRSASALTDSLPTTAWRLICKRCRMNSMRIREMCGQQSSHCAERTPSDSAMITAADGGICSGRKRKHYRKI